MADPVAIPRQTNDLALPSVSVKSSTLASLPKRINRLSFHEEPDNLHFSHNSLQINDILKVESGFYQFIRNQLADRGLPFDAFQYDSLELMGIVMGMFYRQGIATTSSQLNKLLEFLYLISQGYQSNPYHTWAHAVDVTMVVYTILTEFNVGEFFSRAEVTALLLAAVTHDVLHPGRNNLFQININAPVAKKYDGVSVLENQSIDYAVEVLRQVDLLRLLTLEEGDPRSLSRRLDKLHVDAVDASESEAESDSGLWIQGLAKSAVGGLKKGRPRSIKDPHLRQKELEKLVFDILTSSILYTDMKTHFLLTDQLEQLIEHVDDTTHPTTPTPNPSNRRGSLMVIPHADDANPVSPRIEKAEFIESEAGDSEGKQPRSGYSTEDESNPSSKAPSMTLRNRRRSVIIPHADDAHPSAINQDDIVLDSAPPTDSPLSNFSMRRKSNMLDQPPPPPSQARRPSVQFSDAGDQIHHFADTTNRPTSIKSRASSIKSEHSTHDDDSALHFEQRKLLLNAILHAADISNVARPWPIAKKWSDLVVEEFFLQGDEEKKFGLTVSPNMDRDTADQYQISIGFIDFLAKPFFEALAELLPAIQEMADNINENSARWKKMQQDAQANVPVVEIETSSTNVQESESPFDPLVPTSPQPPRGPLRVDTGGAVEFPSDANISPPKTARSSMSSAATEPRRKRSSASAASAHLSPFDDRRLSTAAGVADLPDEDWWEKHRTMRRISSSQGRGLAALQSFTSFLTWKRLHSGASTPNLAALNEEGSDDDGAGGRDDVLAAIHWYEARDSPTSPRRQINQEFSRRTTNITSLTPLTPHEEKEDDVPKERRLSRTALPAHLRGGLQRSISVDTAQMHHTKTPWSTRREEGKEDDVSETPTSSVQQ